MGRPRQGNSRGGAHFNIIPTPHQEGNCGDLAFTLAARIPRGGKTAGEEQGGVSERYRPAVTRKPKEEEGRETGSRGETSSAQLQKTEHKHLTHRKPGVNVRRGRSINSSSTRPGPADNPGHPTGSLPRVGSETEPGASI